MYCSCAPCPLCWNLFPPNRVYHLWRLLHKEYPSGDAALPGAPEGAKARREKNQGETGGAALVTAGYRAQRCAYPRQRRVHPRGPKAHRIVVAAFRAAEPAAQGGSVSIRALDAQLLYQSRGEESPGAAQANLDACRRLNYAGNSAGRDTGFDRCNSVGHSPRHSGARAVRFCRLASEPGIHNPRRWFIRRVATARLVVIDSWLRSLARGPGMTA